MSRAAGFLYRVRAWLRRDTADRETADEFAFHIEQQTAKHIAAGYSADDARRMALREFGGGTLYGETVRETRGLPLDGVVADLRHAARTLARAPGFSLAVVLTLALGIGANAAMFTIVNAVLFRPLPYPESERIVSLSRVDDGRDTRLLDDAMIIALTAGGAPSLEAVAAASSSDMVVQTGDGPRLITGSRASSQYFAVYGFAPLQGRTYTADEDTPSAPAVAVLSEQLWRNVFAADPGVLGRSVLIDDKAHTVIGVMPAALTTARRAQFWIPLRLTPPRPGTVRGLSTVGRLRHGASGAAVVAEMNTVRQRLQGDLSAQQQNQRRDVRSVVMTLHERRFGDSRRALMLLWTTVAVLLVMACANIANLSLARATRREREFSLRLALGASRLRVVRYVLCESLLLSTAGAALGAILAMTTVGYFVRISPGSVANAVGVRVDGTALGFTLLVAVVTAVLFGLVPALRAARGQVSAALANGTPRTAGSRREHLARRMLIIGQLAAALVMLTGASLVTKTLARVTAIDLGFTPDNVVIIRPTLGRVRYTAETAAAFYRDLMARLRTDGDVRAVALVDAVPLGGIRQSVMTEDSAGHRVSMDLVSADAEYLSVIGAHLVEGRWFTTGDAPGTPKIAVVNESLAREQFPGMSAIGRTIDVNGKWTVVGVVRDIRQRALEETPRPTAFFPLAQQGYDQFLPIVVRAASITPALTDRIRTMVRELDAAQVPPAISSMRERFDEATATRRFTVVLLAVFAGLAAMLAIVGLYGVQSYLVAERTREIGIRAALGADAGKVLRFVLGSGLAVTVIGVVLGAGVAAFSVRVLKSMVYDMSVYDPWMFGASALVLVGVATLASYLPARRAASIDPVVALRTD
jgi:predicted permease